MVSEPDLARFRVGPFDVSLDDASQTLVSLQSRRDNGFDFLPSQFLSRRRYDGAHNIGDVTIRYRSLGSGSQWACLDSATRRGDTVRVEGSDRDVVSAADMTAMLSGNADGTGDLRVRREWLDLGQSLGMRVSITNASSEPVEVGSLGFPIQISNIMTGLSDVEVQDKCSLADPCISLGAGYVQVSPVRGTGSALVVLPYDNPPLEAWRFLPEPDEGLLGYGGQTFEGNYEWQVHTKAWAEREWAAANPWHSPASSKVLDPNATYTVGLRFILAASISEVGDAVVGAGVPFAECVPGYIIPMDGEAVLTLRHMSSIVSIDTKTAFTVHTLSSHQDVSMYSLIPIQSVWGRAVVTVLYGDGRIQTVHCYITKSGPQVLSDLGAFFTSRVYHTDASDPFGRAPSVMTYDRDLSAIVLEDPRVWVAGLSDEGGTGAYVASMMKQSVQPSQNEVTLLDDFIHETLWGSVQKDGQYAVVSSVYFYDPSKTTFAYDPHLDYSGWASWNKARSDSVWRAYNYIWPTIAYWVFYRLARDYPRLKLRASWDWYLSQACKTIRYCFESRGQVRYADGGLMGETSVLELLNDLRREGWIEQHDALRDAMKARMAVWSGQAVPFSSEMPWDSTGQEAVHAWSSHFGVDDKREQSIQTIVGFMPSIAHWGWNGNARRYWDFLNGGKTRRFERQIHHYGSGLNAIPALREFESDPTQHHLLKIGYAGISAPLSNVDQDGFASCAFHSWPETLDWDPLSGDYLGIIGPCLAGGVYIVERGSRLVVFGGQVVQRPTGIVTVEPRDPARKRISIAMLGLKIELSAGAIRSVAWDVSKHTVTLEVDTSARTSRDALLYRATETLVWLGQPGFRAEKVHWTVVDAKERVREGALIPLSLTETTIIRVSHQQDLV